LHVNALINASVQQVYLYCMLPSAIGYSSHLQDATGNELDTHQAILIACQLE